MRAITNFVTVTCKSRELNAQEKEDRMKILLKLVITLVLVGVITWHLGGLGQVGGLMTRMDPLYAALILAAITADRALMTFKWARLLHARGLRLPFLTAMKMYCSSKIWGMFLPTTVGADAIRACSASRAALDSNEVVASIIIERSIGFLSGLLLGLFSLVLLAELGSLDSRFDFVWWLGIAILIGATIIFVASFSRRAFNCIHSQLLYRFRAISIMRRLQQFHSTYLAYKDNKRNLVTFFGLTFIEQLMPILQSWLIARGLGVDVSLLYIAAAVPLAFLISRIPVSIDGLGVFEGVFLLLISPAGVPAAEAIAIPLTGRILSTASCLPWWMAYVIGSRSLQPPRPLPEQS